MLSHQLQGRYFLRAASEHLIEKQSALLQLLVLADKIRIRALAVFSYRLIRDRHVGRQQEMQLDIHHLTESHQRIYARAAIALLQEAECLLCDIHG